MSCLVVISGRAKGRTFKITPDHEAVVGRISECDVCIADPHISRRHCVISAGQTGYFIKDLGSANGVVLNGVKVTDAALKDGDKLQFGKVEVEFHQEERFEDAETKKLAAAAAAAAQAAGSAAAVQVPPRKRSGRADTQPVVEFCARCSGSVAASAVTDGKARRLREGLVCPECLAKDSAGSDAAAAVARLAAEAGAKTPPPRLAAAPAAADSVIELDDDGLPVVPDEHPKPAALPKVSPNDATTPIPGGRGKLGR